MPKAFLLALAVIAFIYGLELFVLPINAFTFRVYEALLVKKFTDVLPGAFYPNMKVRMDEQGDLKEYTEFAVIKRVEWITDKYGYRKRNEDVDKYDIVVIGDSDAAGCSLTQDDMYTEHLERLSGIKAYPLAPSNINVFLNSPRFIKNPPKIVILECIERNLTDLPDININKDGAAGQNRIKYAVKEFLKKNPWLAILCDRMHKRIMFQYVVERVHRVLPSLRDRIVTLVAIPQKETETNTGPKMFCLENDNNTISNETMERIAQTVKTYKEALNKRSIQFIFFPLPDNKTIYWKELLLKEKPVFLERIMPKLKEKGIEVLDVESTFRKISKENNTLLYHTDDAHWNSAGSRLSAELTVRVLEKIDSDIKKISN